MNAITLKRKIKVHCWRVQGTVAKAQEREVLLSVLKRVQERPSADAEDVATHLLFEGVARKVVARRLLEIGRLYDLLTEHRGRYKITEKGEQALNQKKVFVPEEGTWIIWFSGDLLLPNPILKIDVWNEPDAYDEVRGQKKEESKKRIIDPIPDLLHGQVKKPQPALASPGDTVRLEELKNNGELVQAISDLKIIWQVSKKRLLLKGNLDGSPVDTHLEPPEVELPELWELLLQQEGLLQDWDDNHKWLMTPFNTTQVEARESMETTLKFRHPSHHQYDSFEPISVGGVRIMASSKLDALEWAKWRLENRLNSYATEENFSKWTAEAVAPFMHFNLELPSRRQLATAAWGERQNKNQVTAWHLIAAEDWRL